MILLLIAPQSYVYLITHKPKSAYLRGSAMRPDVRNIAAWTLPLVLGCLLRKGMRMRAKVDEDLCTGCGLCVDTCPDVFELPGDVAQVKVDVVPDDAEECAREAAENCPVEAISIE